MALDKYGFPQGFRTSAMLEDLKSAAAEVESLKDQWVKDGFGTEEIAEFVTGHARNKLIDGLKSRVAAANSPNSPSTGRPEIEGEAVHRISAAQIKLEKTFQEKIPLFKPDDEIQSAVKAMQINIDNISNQMNYALQSFGSYADAVVRPPMDMQGMLQEVSSANAKYMKVIFNKMNEYTNKKLNAELSKTISAMPASKRAMFADMKQVINQNTLKQYSGISNGIGGMLSGILSKALNVDSLVEQAITKANNPITPNTKALFKDWIPGMIVEAGEKLRFRNNVYTVETSGQTGTSIPNVNLENQFTGNVKLKFDSVATGDPFNVGDSEETNEVRYGDIPTHPTVPICYAEDVIGQAINDSKEAIDQANNSVVNGMNAFLGDVISELGLQEDKAKPKAQDSSLNGKVITISDEEGLGSIQGGNYYVTMVDAGTISGGSVRNRGVGIASTAPGSGNGLTVNIVVSEGGATGTTTGELYIKLLTGGNGYQTSGASSTGSFTNANTSGGSGSGCKATITFTSGVVTLITIAEDKGGTGYKKGDVLTVTGGSGTGCTFEIIKPRGRIDQFGITINNGGTGYEMGELITVQREEYNGVAPDATFTIIQTTDPGSTKISTPTSGKNKPQGLGSMLSKLGDIGGSLSAALDFKNVVGNVFPFELPPNPPVSDFYTLSEGGGSLPDGQKPSFNSLAQGVISRTKPEGLTIPKTLPFAQPFNDTPDVENDEIK